MRLFAASTSQVQKEWKEKEHGPAQVAFSPDGEHLVVAGPPLTPRHKNISIRDVASGELQQEIGSHASPVQMEYAPDGKSLIVRDWGETIQVLDVETGQQRWQLLDQSGFALAPVLTPFGTSRSSREQSRQVSPEETSQKWAVLCRGRNGLMQKRAITTGRVLGQWTGRANGVRHVGIVDDYDAWSAVAPGGEWVAGKADDGSIKLWDAARGQLRLSFLVTPSAVPNAAKTDISPDWIAYTPEGYYNSSAGADKFLCWRQGTQLFPASKFQAMFRKP